MYKIDIDTPLGTITFTSGDKKRIIFLLSPSGGGKDTPWMKTGIEIKNGDDIEITASGRVNTAMRRIVTQAIMPGIDDPTWVGPNGLKKSQRFAPFELYEQEKLKPNEGDNYYGFGMLLATVKEPNEDVKPESIRTFPQDENGTLKFEAQKDGELVLTVNDIWLKEGEEGKKVYAPNPNENDSYYDYYLQLAKAEAFKEDVDSWDKETKDKKVGEQHEKRKKGWENIEENDNWNAWYDDNIGSFSVAIVVNSGAK